MSTEQNISTRQQTPAGTVTLAVFPFENLTPGDETALFCSSFCSDLTIELSRFRQFQLISNDSLREVSDVREAVLSLGSDYHIRGSFRADQEKIRVNAQLINSHSLHMVWANRFEAPIDRMMDLQENLLEEVLGSLQDQLNYDLLSRFRKKERTEFNAYEYWLHGMDEMKRGTPESDERARSYFREAISIDPGYSLAYTGMSLTYFNDLSCQLWERWEVNQNGAFEWAEKAMELDEHNYIAAAVLGRIFLYKEAFETSEHYVRRSLRLNNNDPSTLIQNAVSLIYTGHAAESEKLYLKARRINPANALNYNHIGIFIYLEQGKYEEAEKLITNSPTYPWVDTNVFIGAAYYHLGDYKKARDHWDAYMKEFDKKISKSSENTIREAIDWFITVNPFRGESKVFPYLEFIGKKKLPVNTPKAVEFEGLGTCEFIREGELWLMNFGGRQVMIPEVKGFHDLQTLLENPQQPFHCAELMDSVLHQQGEEILDQKAKKEYQRRILSLQEEIEAAEELNDYERASELQQEYDELLEHLSGALGLSGKSRKAGSSIEKARSAVTWRIRSAISKIEKAHPRLGAHLANSIRTGTTCSYTPEEEISWNN